MEDGFELTAGTLACSNTMLNLLIAVKAVMTMMEISGKARQGTGDIDYP